MSFFFHIYLILQHLFLLYCSWTRSCHRSKVLKLYKSFIISCVQDEAFGGGRVAFRSIPSNGSNRQPMLPLPRRRPLGRYEWLQSASRLSRRCYICTGSGCRDRPSLWHPLNIKVFAEPQSIILPARVPAECDAPIHLETRLLAGEVLPLNLSAFLFFSTLTHIREMRCLLFITKKEEGIKWSNCARGNFFPLLISVNAAVITPPLHIVFSFSHSVFRIGCTVRLQRGFWQDETTFKQNKDLL